MGVQESDASSHAADASAVTVRLATRKRDLPHWEMGGSTYFRTFRLHGLPEDLPALSANERDLVKRAILLLHDRMWHVHLLTVMPDHVHILATPLMSSPGKWHPLATMLQRVKGSTAYSINTRRHRSGQFWQKETFDRIVRDQQEFDEKAIYILNNAMKAGIADDGWEYDGFWCGAEERAAG